MSNIDLFILVSLPLREKFVKKQNKIQCGSNQSGMALRMKRYSENCWPSTPPPLEAAMLKLAFSKRVIAWRKLTINVK